MTDEVQRKLGDIPVPVVIPDTPMQEQKQASGLDEIARRSAGQRRINVIWEYTQAFIAGAVVISVLIVASWLSVKGVDGEKVAAFVFLTGVANLVIGFYFGRTNHQRVGGIGGGAEMQGR